MRKIFLLSVTFLLLTMFSCEKERNKTATIIRDCTGTYLRLDGNDYKVCNLEKVSSFSDNSSVKVTFKIIDECEGSGNFNVTCYLYHDFESWVDVEKIE